MENIIRQFYEDVSEKISLTYNQELFSVFDNMPSPIINFNDIALLKKAQLYVRHTDRIFNKSVARLIQRLFENKQIEARTCADWAGKCVYVYPIKTRFHFVAIEKFAGFPHVSWLKETVSSNTKKSTENNIYIVMIKADDKGVEYLNLLNSYQNEHEKKYYTFEEFINTIFGEKAWRLIDSSLQNIQKDAEDLQWFELARTTNSKNIKVFNESLKDEILNFDYYTELSHTSIIMDDDSFALIGNRFFKENLYQMLFDYSDFSKSFLTSEWLYKNHMRNDLLDKTYVITGYLKSIEQLLYSIIHKMDSAHTIGISAPEGMKNISVDSPDFYKATLGNMVYFLRNINNRDVYFQGISKMSISGITLIINKWVQSERNGYFHKHNMSSLEKVTEIRNSTFLLYYLILGSLANNNTSFVNDEENLHS